MCYIRWMFLVRYEIKRHVQNPPDPDFAIIGFFDTKIVFKKHLNKYLSEGWYIHRKHYLLWTPFRDWWLSLTTDQKITIIGIIIGSIISIAGIYFGFIKE